MSLNASDKNVLVTGGAVRLGRAICYRLAEAGANLAIHYRQSREAAEETLSGVKDRGGNGVLVEADFEQTDDVRSVLDDAGELGVIYALVNNASVFDPQTFETTDEETWDRAMDVNAKAPFLLSRQFCEQLGDRKGRIVNLLDWRAEQPRDDHFAYSVSKGALANLTRSLAVDLAPQVQVNAILPGAVLPPEGKTEEALSHVVEEVPAGRWGSPSDIAESVLFLIAGPSYINGAFLHVDGGRHLM